MEKITVVELGVYNRMERYLEKITVSSHRYADRWILIWL